MEYLDREKTSYFSIIELMDKFFSTKSNLFFVEIHLYSPKYHKTVDSKIASHPSEGLLQISL